MTNHWQVVPHMAILVEIWELQMIIAAIASNIKTGSPTDDLTSKAPTMAQAMHLTLFSYIPTNFPTLGTEAPTFESPTTEVPTKAPTKKPTTMQPTLKPTVKPTSLKPTTLPTKKPTSPSNCDQTVPPLEGGESNIAVCVLKEYKIAFNYVF